MKLRQNALHDLFATVFVSALAITAVAGIWLSAPSPALAGTPADWVEYVDETATRLVADAALGVEDPEEKDLISGDVDKDGDADLIVVRKLPFTVAGPRRNVFFFNDDGILVDRTAAFVPDFLDATDDREVVLVDVDGDTWLDIVTAGTFSEQPRVLINRGVSDLSGWLGFVYEPDRLPEIVPGPKFCGLGAGDVTGNGRPDLYFADYENDTEDRLLINDGTGFFTDETAARIPAPWVESVFGTDADIVDVNGDGFNDIIKNNSSGTNGGVAGSAPVVSILYNDGTGNFVFKDDVYSFAPYMTEAADFTKDGRLDLFIVDDNQDRYLINTGNDVDGHAQFTTINVANSPNTQGFGGNVKFADLDGDNVLDVLVADVDTDIDNCNPAPFNAFTLLRGRGPAPDVSYSDPLSGAGRPWLVNGVFDVEPMHIDDDGVLDLWVGSCTGNRVFMGRTPVVFADDFESGDVSIW